MKIANPAKIKIWNPIKFPEKISKKNPAAKATPTPNHERSGVKKLKKVIRIKIKPYAKNPLRKILKWTKKLI